MTFDEVRFGLLDSGLLLIAYPESDELRVRPRDAISPALANGIRQHKGSIMDMLVTFGIPWGEDAFYGWDESHLGVRRSKRVE
jgi:hypothetical protein